ncbi:pyridoxal phosphate-dependent aminotransferase [Serratia sp. NPDC078593]|uniref:pyridoxal phosphate-dependent aminotransferase n=1 Tax=unclassified Serratia (in: enterobacteria) TaxID=2647522 RepID=UPI0037CCD190
MFSPDNVLDSGNLPNPLADAQLIDDIAHPESLIYLSLGETWLPPANGLVQALSHIPEYAHGYTLSPYGLPALRRTLREYIVRTHNLPERDNFDVAVSQVGTRGAMANFAQLLLTKWDSEPTALVPTPGWDYAGVLTPLGYHVKEYPLLAERGWQPNPDEIEKDMKSGTLLVINAQHNPTGANWSPQILARLMSSAIERGCAILIDDAYYAIHDPDVSPGNALQILLDLSHATSAPPWLAVRTLGKQFRCNGWGIGALTGHPDTLAELAYIAHQRSYGSGLPLQHAMASWLENPAADLYVNQLCAHYAEMRKHACHHLIQHLGFPIDSVHSGQCTSYMRFQVPQRFIVNNDEDNYRKCCLKAGVLPGRGSMTRIPLHGEAVYVRIHLGHSADIIDLAFKRLGLMGLGWD